LSGLFMNSKQFIENKEYAIWNRGAMASSYHCANAETKVHAEFRRPQWRHVNVSGEDDMLRPCGLVSLSMFDDRFRMERCSDADPDCKDPASPVDIDESGLLLPADGVMWERLKPTDGDSWPHYKLDLGNGTVVGTWLPNDPAFVEHFKVWNRQPMSPIVRHLWGILGPLEAGHYRIWLDSNDRIWQDRWHAEKKSVIVSELSLLGNSGACHFLGYVAMIVAILEALFCIIMLASRK